MREAIRTATVARVLLLVTATALLTTGVLPGQQSPKFETASVRRAEPLTLSQRQLGVAGNTRVDDGRIEMSHVSLSELIWRAYEVKPFQLTGPAWLSELRLDLAATLPIGASREQIPAMLKELLAERFGLKVHVQQKDFSVYTLTRGKGALNLKAVRPDASAESGSQKARTSLNEHDVLHMEFSTITMRELAEVLARFADRPVLDQTGFAGSYSLTLDISQQELRRRAGGVERSPAADPAELASDPGGDGLSAAVQRLGLTLQAQKQPLNIIVIDEVRKTPLEN